MLTRIYSNLRRNNLSSLQKALYASNQGYQKTPMDQGSFGTKGQEYYGKKAEDIKSSDRKMDEKSSTDLGKQMQDKFQDWKGKVEEKGQDIKQELKQSVTDKTRDIKETVQDKAQDLQEGAKNMAGYAVEKGKEYMGTASDLKEKGKEAMENVKENLTDMKDKAKSMGNQAYHMGAAGFEQVKRDAKDAVDETVSSDRSWTQQAKETAENLTGIHSTQDLKQKISDVAEKAKETIQSWVGSNENASETKERERDTTKDFNREKMQKK